MDVMDGVLILGAIAGVIYYVIGTINSANPIVLAVVGIVTIVITGVEAKKIIDKFSQKIHYFKFVFTLKN